MNLSLDDNVTRLVLLLVAGVVALLVINMKKKLLGDKVAKKVGKIWGIGEDGEMANMWKATPQKGLWFMAGSLAQCRIYSKYLALQIKIIEEELR